MTNTIRMRGELPFPAAGEGVVLRFTNPDCDLLQRKFGDTWFVDAIPRINRFDMEYIREAVRVGVKKDGKKHTVDFDALDCPVGEIAELVLDSLFLAMHGRSFNDHLSYIDSMRAANAGKDEDSGNA